MRKSRLMIIITGVILLLLLFAACDKNNFNEALLGKWTCNVVSYNTSKTLSLEFFSDGSCVGDVGVAYLGGLNPARKVYSSEVISWTYLEKEDLLKIVTDDDDYYFQIKITDNTMTMENMALEKNQIDDIVWKKASSLTASDSNKEKDDTSTDNKTTISVGPIILLENRTVYNSDGTRDYWEDYLYDAYGNETNYARRDSEGRRVSSRTSVYSEIGNIINREYWEDTNDGHTLRTKYTYDAQQVKETTHYRDYSKHEIIYNIQETGLSCYSANYDSDGNRTDWEEYTCDMRGNVIYREVHKDDWTWYGEEFTYDEQDRPLSYYKYDSAFNCISSAERTYNERGQELSHFSYDSDGNRSAGYEFTCDAQGRTLSVYGYGYDGKCSSSTEYTYDKKGNKGSSYSYDSNGNCTGSAEITYNEQGKVVIQLNYDSAGKSTSGFEYTYNEQGRRVRTKTTRYDSNGTITGWTEDSFIVIEDPPIVPEGKITLPKVSPSYIWFYNP